MKTLYDIYEENGVTPSINVKKEIKNNVSLITSLPSQYHDIVRKDNKLITSVIKDDHITAPVIYSLIHNNLITRVSHVIDILKSKGAIYYGDDKYTIYKEVLIFVSKQSKKFIEEFFITFLMIKYINHTLVVMQYPEIIDFVDFKRIANHVNKLEKMYNTPSMVYSAILNQCRISTEFYNNQMMNFASDKYVNMTRDGGDNLKYTDLTKYVPYMSTECTRMREFINKVLVEGKDANTPQFANNALLVRSNMPSELLLSLDDYTYIFDSNNIEDEIISKLDSNKHSMYDVFQLYQHATTYKLINNYDFNKKYLDRIRNTSILCEIHNESVRKLHVDYVLTNIDNLEYGYVNFVLSCYLCKNDAINEEWIAPYMADFNPLILDHLSLYKYAILEPLVRMNKSILDYVDLNEILLKSMKDECVYRMEKIKERFS